jgi:hypothetical protein
MGDGEQPPGSHSLSAYFVAGAGVTVSSWHPTPDGTGPATQVHMRFGRPPEPVFVVRLRSAHVVDGLMDALAMHRDEVWGPRPDSPVRMLGALESARRLLQETTEGHRGCEAAPCSWCRLLAQVEDALAPAAPR